MSAPEKRRKAQQALEEANFVLDARAEFQVAFPKVEKCLVAVEESGRGISEWEKGRPRGHQNPGEYIDCHNPLCNGGFQVGPIIREMVQGRETTRRGTAYCFGQEVSPKGRRIHGRCGNSFQYEITITYKP